MGALLPYLREQRAVFLSQLLFSLQSTNDDSVDEQHLSPITLLDALQ